MVFRGKKSLFNTSLLCFVFAVSEYVLYTVFFSFKYLYQNNSSFIEELQE